MERLGNSENENSVEEKVTSMNERNEQERRNPTPVITSIALLGLVATTAWLAYRRLHGKPLPSVGDLMDAADKAAQALEDRVNDFAVAS